MDVYRIGVSIALANGVSPVLGIIARDMLGLKTKVADVENNFNRWAKAAGGVAAVLGGTAMLGAMGKLVEHGRELVHQQELMKIAGMTNQEIAQATAQAYKTSSTVQTTTISKNLKHLRELRYAFGNLDVAKSYLDQVAKSNAILSSVKGGGTDQVWELVKSLEQKGETANPADFMKYVDIMTQAVIASGGRVTPQQFFSTFKYGRTAMLGWDEEFVGQYLPRLIQSMSGGGGSGGSGSGGPGNTLMSAFAKVVQGQMPKKAAEEFERLHLVTGYIMKAGGGTFTIEGGIKGADLFQHNPYKWVQTFLMPALANNGITSQEKIIEEVSRLFPVRTASQVIAEMSLQGSYHEGGKSPFEKDAALARAAMKTSRAYGSLAGNDPNTVMGSFHAQWNAMLEAIGSPMVAPAMDVMKRITAVFSSIGQFAGAHPEAARLIGEAIAAMGIALVAIGGISLAMLVGLPALIVAAAGALGTLVALEWDRVKAGAQAVVDAISLVIAALGRLASAAANAVKSMWDRMSDWFHHTNYDGGAPGGLLNGARVAPAGGRQAINVPIKLDIDGRTLAEAVGSQLASLYENSSLSPAANGVAMLDLNGGFTAS